jgi:asparagine synthase (glutamine-hydrolysing)
MCGIYGYWNITGEPVNLDRILHATTILQHRGPDDEGFLLGDTRQGLYRHCGGAETTAVNALRIERSSGEGFDFAFGFRRLAILDLSQRGHQPMSSVDGRWWIVFNGEIYNYRELRAELSGYGHSFRGGSDTEVILAAFQQWGTACLDRFNGMWAFAIWDTLKRTLFLARDRFGIKPLHYIWDGRRFVFASEIKALVGEHGVPFVPDDRAVYQYLIWGELPSPSTGETFFSNVHALPPAHYLTLAGGALIKTRYYSLPQPIRLGDADADTTIGEYRQLFQEAVRLHLRSDVPVGTCLSGGIDSSSIVCVINRIMAERGLETAQVGERQKTFSAVYRSAGRYNERDHIETVLKATKAEPNFTFPTGEQLSGELQRLAWHQEEPFGSTSIFAQWCVMAKVRERGVTVLLDGQGADEALGGYRPYGVHLAELLKCHQYRSAFRASRDMNHATGLPQLPVWAQALARQAPDRWIRRYREVREARRAAVLRAALRDSSADAVPPERTYGGLAEHLKELITETSLPHLLRYEDRNAMAFAVEGRVPFVDHRLIEYSLTKGLAWCIHRGWTKWILREAMRGLVPQEILWRRDKVGFETPETEWLESCLARQPDLFHEGARSGRYVEPRTARALLQDWLSRKGSSAPIWRLVNLELWLQAFSSSPLRSSAQMGVGLVAGGGERNGPGS